MQNKRKIFRDYIIASLALSMIIIFWVFCVDALFYGMWSNFKIIGSILTYAFIICLVQIVIRLVLDDKPVISILAEYMVVVLLFFAFGMKFNWYPKGSEWFAFIYTIPAYAVGYLLRLVGVRKDADYINKRLAERKKREKHKIITSFASNLKGRGWKMMFILLSAITLCIIALLVILLIQSQGKVRPVLDKNGMVIEGSISEKVYVPINGVKMGMVIKSKNRSNPVLLFVHGGPGMPEYPFIEEYPTGLEEHFTVVWWDQRGAGLSYNSNIPKETMTTEQFVSDTIKVTNYLRQRFGQDKIYLMAHSWGSYIAIQAAAKSPELYRAYIGVGQITNQIESEKIAYEYMIKYYKAAGDEKTVKKLEEASFKTMNYMPSEYNKIRDDAMHRAGIGTTHKMKSVVTGIFMPVMQNREYTLREKINIWRGKAFSSSTVLNDELYKMDLSKKITKIHIPVYFFSGMYDYTVNYSMSEDYLKKLDAPVKGFYLFKNSAHSPMFEEPKKMMQIMQENVGKGKNDLADIH